MRRAGSSSKLTINARRHRVGILYKAPPSTARCAVKRPISFSHSIGIACFCQLFHGTVASTASSILPPSSSRIHSHPTMPSTSAAESAQSTSKRARKRRRSETDTPLAPDAAAKRRREEVNDRDPARVTTASDAGGASDAPDTREKKKRKKKKKKVPVVQQQQSPSASDTNNQAASHAGPSVPSSSATPRNNEVRVKQRQSKASTSRLLRVVSPAAGSDYGEDEAALQASSSIKAATDAVSSPFLACKSAAQLYIDGFYDWQRQRTRCLSSSGPIDDPQRCRGRTRYSQGPLRHAAALSHLPNLPAPHAPALRASTLRPRLMLCLPCQLVHRTPASNTGSSTGSSTGPARRRASPSSPTSTECRCSERERSTRCPCPCSCQCPRATSPARQAEEDMSPLPCCRA